MKQNTKHKANHCHIDPVLYRFYLRLKDGCGLTMVHRRRRKSATCIEVVINISAFASISGRLNTLREAEACGYWVVIRRQAKGKHATWRGKAVFQLFLTPVHPKKRHAARVLAQNLVQQAETVTFEPVIVRSRRPNSVNFILFGEKKLYYLQI